jgi:hypothetical protein
MSSTLAVILKELQPNLKIAICGVIVQLIETGDIECARPRQCVVQRMRD